MKSYDVFIILKIDNPDVDIQLFLKDSRPTFQKYIEDGLSQIDREKHLLEGGDGGNAGSMRLENNRTHLQDSNVGGIKTPEYHMARLQALIVSVFYKFFKNVIF